MKFYGDYAALLKTLCLVVFEGERAILFCRGNGGRLSLINIIRITYITSDYNGCISGPIRVPMRSYLAAAGRIKHLRF